MKGIILAGGKGSRLYPLTKTCNKLLLPVGQFPMIYYPIFKLRQAGIDDILIVTGRDDIGPFALHLGNGSDFNVNLTYRVQEKAAGIGDALLLGKDFVGDSPFVLFLGDNLFEDDLSPMVKRFAEQTKKAHIFLTEVDEPRHFGIAELQDNTIVSIEEKPVQPKSRYAVTGIYLYQPEVFDVISKISHSSRGELEITDVNNHFISTGEISHDVLAGWWVDAGTLPAYYKINQLIHSANFPSNSAINPS